MNCTQLVWAFPSDLLTVLYQKACIWLHWVHLNINCKFVSVLCFNVSVIKPLFRFTRWSFVSLLLVFFLIGLIDCYSMKQVRSHGLQSASNRCLAVPVAVWGCSLLPLWFNNDRIHLQSKNCTVISCLPGQIENSSPQGTCPILAYLSLPS